ncbi:MAG: flagellar hook-basal body complex protein FliE [Pseudomonadota bacterium]
MIDPVGPVKATDAVRAAIGVTAPQPTSFSDTMSQVATNARDALRGGEAAAISGVSGETAVQDVVQALMGAEQQLRAAIAVRDRVVAAYQEISRMQI